MIGMNIPKKKKRKVDQMIMDLERENNDELRQKFIDQTIPQIEVLGLEYPDPEIKYQLEERNSSPCLICRPITKINWRNCNVAFLYQTVQEIYISNK